MQDYPKGFAFGRGSNPNLSKYRTKATNEPFDDGDDDDDYIERASTYKNI